MTTFRYEHARYQVLVRLSDRTLDIGYVAANGVQCEYCSRLIQAGEVFTTQPYGPRRAHLDPHGGLGIACSSLCRPCTVIKEYRP